MRRTIDLYCAFTFRLNETEALIHLSTWDDECYFVFLKQFDSVLGFRVNFVSVVSEDISRYKIQKEVLKSSAFQVQIQVGPGSLADSKWVVIKEKVHLQKKT